MLSLHHQNAGAARIVVADVDGRRPGAFCVCDGEGVVESSGASQFCCYRCNTLSPAKLRTKYGDSGAGEKVLNFLEFDISL